MTRWFPVEPADAALFTSAPHVFRYEKRFAASPERVWASLTSDESLAAWGSTVSAVHWLTPRPFGIGTTREVVLAPGLVRVRERYFRWDEGSGYSFTVYEASIPLFRHFAEDYTVEPDGEGTTFRWTVAITPKPAFALPVRVLAPVLRVAFGRMASDGQRHFADPG